MTIADWIPIFAGTLALIAGCLKVYSDSRKSRIAGQNLKIEIDGRVLTVSGPVDAKELEDLARVFASHRTPQ